MPRWPSSPSSATRSMASGTTPSHPTSSRHEAVISRRILTLDHGRAQGALASIVGDLHRTRERHKGQKLIAGAAKLPLEVMRQITPGWRLQDISQAPLQGSSFRRKGRGRKGCDRAGQVEDRAQPELQSEGQRMSVADVSSSNRAGEIWLSRTFGATQDLEDPGNSLARHVFLVSPRHLSRESRQQRGAKLKGRLF